MEDPESKNDYSAIVKTLMDMFGEILTEDVIYSIVENFGGDLQESANAIMLITMDEDIERNKPLKSNTESNTIIYNEDSNTTDLSNTRAVSQPISFSYSSPKLETEATPDYNATMSYASASRTGAVPKQITRSAKVSNALLDPATMQFNQIISYHNDGTRTLIILRGVSGSGKSYLAKKIIDAIYQHSGQQNYETHIFCADNYFMRGGIYCYDKSRLQDAHSYNQTQAKQAMIKGVSPVIIDNTHTEIWEMEPYVRYGVQNGYIIEVMEPNTPWAKNKNELMKRNIHDVPIYSIKRMLERYEGGVNGTDLIIKFRCDYSTDMRPPVKRTHPPLVCNEIEESNETINREINNALNSKCIEEETPQKPYKDEKPYFDQYRPRETMNNASNGIILPVTSSITSINESMPANISTDVPIETMNNASNGIISPNTSSIISIDEAIPENISTNDRYKEVQKRIEEIEQVENEWENGEDWEDKYNPNCNTEELNEMHIDSKPQRQNKAMRPSSYKNLMASVKEIQDWSKISMFMPPWNDHENVTLPKDQTQLEHVKKISSYTCMESGDSDIYRSKNPLKIVSATSRNINEYHVESNHIKIPGNWMLDKSTSTNDNTNSYKCPHEEQHFTAFSKLFKSISKTDLRDIFDKCHGDVNWAVDLVLDSMSNKSFNITDRNDLSDTEAENQNNEQCECLAAYNIIPRQNISNSIRTSEMEVSPSQFDLPQTQGKKVKKGISEESIQLKRQIEQNIVIAENHYSQHCLKIRKMRRGDFEETVNMTDTLDEFRTSAIDENVSNTIEPLEETSGEICDNDSNACGENTVSIELTREFIVQLDRIFGRNHINYPENMTSKIDMPMSILNEINALWTQSLAYQLEENANQKQIMIQQDEEFARQLATKEAELIKAGKEPEIPDFKEIMDMDFAISLYQKDVADWRNNEPNNLAAKMSREKLHNLFPDIQPDTLSELLMAHDNNFQSTVEVLLMSIGKVEILENKNGINKFIMEKEMERQEKLLEIERKALSEVEWPLLNRDVNVDMAAVDLYRKQADDHLRFRNTHYQKAQDYIRRGMTTVASYYSDVARYHKQKYEQANSLAAASLMQVHANNCSDNATIDLHFLRVGEAKESLDLFLDTHIQKVKEMQEKNKAPWHHTLYFITGRGLHSNGRPRVKPAVIKRLLERGLTYTERNPGLLSAKVYAHNLLSYEIE